MAAVDGAPGPGPVRDCNDRHTCMKHVAATLASICQLGRPARANPNSIQLLGEVHHLAEHPCPMCRPPPGHALSHYVSALESAKTGRRTHNCQVRRAWATSAGRAGQRHRTAASRCWQGAPALGVSCWQAARSAQLTMASPVCLERQRWRPPTFPPHPAVFFFQTYSFATGPFPSHF